MALEPGGRAEKHGHEYEHLWGALQLLRVLNDEAVSVFPEALGDDKEGVDLWVEHENGLRWAHQCKCENASTGKWSIADLGRVGVLQSAKYQLGQGNNHRFVFVSSDPAPALRDLTDRTCTCNNDPDAYFKYSVTTSAHLKRAVDQVCTLLCFDQSSPSGRAEAFDFLSRVRFQSFEKGPYAKETVRGWARQAVEGDNAKLDSVISLLGSLLTDNIGNKLYADQVRDHLRQHGFTLRNLSQSSELQESIKRLKERFLSSLILIDGNVIPRRETAGIIEKILDDSGPRIICIQGRAGCGKSGVLLEVMDELDTKGIPYLPIRLNKHKPTGDTGRFGKEVLSLPSSPGACLKAYAHDRKAVMIIDQLDALRWTHSHSPEAMDVFRETVTEAIAYPNLSVIAACRTFDLNDNPQIRAWKDKQAICQTEIGLLADGQVRQVVNAHGGDWNKLTTKQRAILLLPMHLQLWCKITEGKAAPTFSNSVDLMVQFWDYIRGDVIPKSSVSVDEFRTVIDKLVSYCDKDVPPSRVYL